MGLFDAFQGHRDEFEDTHHGSVTHDLLGGAIAYEAAKAYENHLAANGKPDNHAKAKEVIAGLVGAAATQLVETKGLDAWDEHKRRKAAERAQEQLETVIVNEYN